MKSHDETVEVYANTVWNRSSETANSQLEVPRQKITYEASLRAVGAFFDNKSACRIHVLEAKEGFTVRYQKDEGSSEFFVEQLNHGDLISLGAIAERARRRPFSFRGGSKVKGDPHATYEDVLRALGHELDTAEAYSILLDELEDGLLVTYQYLKPSEGFNARKRMVILGAEAMQAVLEDAHDRRERRKHGIVTILAS